MTCTDKILIATITTFVGVAGREAASEPAAGPPSDPAWEMRPADAVAGAPPPGHESGRLDEPEGDSPGRLVARGLLLLPRMAFKVVFAPIRGGLWANDRYRLHLRAIDLLFDDTRTYGVYPTLYLESGNRMILGARFIHRDLFGAREQLSLDAGSNVFFGQSRRKLGGEIHSGYRFGERLDLSLAGEYERVPDDPFYGVGNDPDQVGPAVDVPDEDFVVDTSFAQRVTRGIVAADLRLVRSLYLRGAGSLSDVELGRNPEDPPIDIVYPASVDGLEDFRQGYVEGELRWDTRRRSSWWEPVSVRSTGWLLAGFGGRVFGLENSGDYDRYGLDLQRFVRLGQGPRVLTGRLYGEAVTGSIDEVPFTQLPKLGGRDLLRGYPRDRFRDRVAAMGSVEYSWALSKLVSASTFVDVGRVYSSIDDLDLSGLRVGFGIGLEIHTENTFIARGHIATSKDGGVFFNLAFDPVFDLEPRVERR